MMPFNGAVFALDGILIGAGDTRFLMWGMLAAAAVYVPDRAARAAPRLGHRRRLVGPGRADRRSSSYVRRTVRRVALGVDRGARLTTLSAPMTRRIALITTLLVLALAAPAGAQSGPFGPLPPADPAPTADGRARRRPTTARPARNVLFVIGGALIVGFGAMGWFIMRDARRSLPEDELAGPRLRDEGPHKHQKQAKAKARAKTRAQKQARKAHRKR